MKCARVRVTFEIVVPFEYVHQGKAESWDDDNLTFNINENSCMGTSNLGLAVERMIEYHNNNGPNEWSSTCWGCAMQSCGDCGQELVEIFDFTPEHPQYEEIVNRQGPWIAEDEKKIAEARVTP